MQSYLNENRDGTSTILWNHLTEIYFVLTHLKLQILKENNYLSERSIASITKKISIGKNAVNLKNKD